MFRPFDSLEMDGRERERERKRYFNKECFLCGYHFKVHFTEEDKLKIILHYGSISAYPRRNMPCMFCKLKLIAYIWKRIPMKCKRCLNFFWISPSYPNFDLARINFLEKNRMWYNFCHKCNHFPSQQVCKIEGEYAMMCKTFEKYGKKKKPTKNEPIPQMSD